jgi:Tfp pilus assembly protein PilF
MNVQRLRRSCVFLAVFFLGAIAGAVVTDYMKSRLGRQLTSYFVAWGAGSYDEGHVLEAISLIMKAVYWDPDWYAPYLQLGQIYQKERCDTLALQCFREAKRLMESADKHQDPEIRSDRQIIDRSLADLAEGNSNLNCQSSEK